MLTICDIELVAEIALPEGVKENPKTMGEYLRKYRYEKKILKKEICAQLNIEYSTLRRWERNEIKISPLYYRRVVGFLGYDPML